VYYCDTHCHLDLRQFDVDRAVVIGRAAAACVRIIIVPAIDLDSCRRVLALADQHPDIYAAVGVHPNDCADFDDETVYALRRLAQHPKVVAIGEIGLDYYWRKVPPGRQKQAMAAQMALAAELGLPVILHSRNTRPEDRSCTTDLLSEIAQLGPMIRKQRPIGAIIGVWHAFSGDLAEARQAYDLGLALGLGGPVTFQNARRLHALAPSLRRDRLLLETDAPYLAPHPHRGQRNEPAYVPLIAQALAGLYHVSIEEIGVQTSMTVLDCFGIAHEGINLGEAR
jgi:TatD DNase family protein